MQPVQKRSATLKPTRNPSKSELVLYRPDGQEALRGVHYTADAERARLDWLAGKFLPHILDYLPVEKKGARV